ncbi:uncharacterized protein LOC118450513 [Vespa mandarinia]|uniref:uncharacterized protein LOC118450513 n=1 Tax=Vespa mandarinia TaxID=7446 RepID=UPI00161FB80D|nr:uncharacterized protein LOC118450513 [Vespa mandarinia]XP_035742213.1 uncharacterized protein LOC118450513 [Vespa mandarinia]
MLACIYIAQTFFTFAYIHAISYIIKKVAMKSKCIQIYHCARWYTLRETEVFFKVVAYASENLVHVLKYATIANDGGRKDINTSGKLLKELKKALFTAKDVNYLENELKEKIQNDKGSRNNLNSKIMEKEQ